MKPAAEDLYSYRNDEQVPNFDDRGPVVFMDGHCVLCTGAARVISRLDQTGAFRICSVQSELGQAILTHYGLDPGNPDSWLLLMDGRAYSSMEAIIRAGIRLGGWGELVRIFQILPRPAQNWLYRRIARNRYSLGGYTDMCALPDPELRRRLLS